MGVVVNLDEDRAKKSSLDALKSYVADDLKADRMIVLAAVKADGSALQHASIALKTLPASWV